MPCELGPSADDGPEASAELSTDIVVTARRRDESAQDVPLVVNTVTSAEINKLNNEYKSAQATAASKEGSLQAQLKASQAEAALAKKCASVMASGLLRIYEDVATIVTYKEVNSVLKEASADCGDVVSVQAP